MKMTKYKFSLSIASDDALGPHDLEIVDSSVFYTPELSCHRHYSLDHLGSVVFVLYALAPLDDLEDVAVFALVLFLVVQLLLDQLQTERRILLAHLQEKQVPRPETRFVLVPQLIKELERLDQELRVLSGGEVERLSRFELRLFTVFQF